MKATARPFNQKADWILYLIIIFCLLASLSVPNISFAVGLVPPTGAVIGTAGGSAAGGAGLALNPAIAESMCVAGAGACVSTSFFGLYTAFGTCTGVGVCTVTGITPMATVGIGAISSVVSGVVQIGIKAFTGGGTTGSSPYSSTNPYGQSQCTGTRYISPTPTSDPCGVYIPTTRTVNPDLNLNPPPPSTSVTTGPTTATLSVVPTSGPAPLKVTFTVTDTTTSCTHQAVMLSAGDGTDAVVALPAIVACRTLAPVTFTYTYKTAGTYTATITTAANPVCAQPPMPACPTGLYCAQVMPQPLTYPNLGAMRGANATYMYDGPCKNDAAANADSKQVLQSVTVTVGGTAATPGGSATLSIAPTSGPAPLKVMFTVTDTSTSCPRSGIVLSAGDGSAPVVALPAAAQCAGIVPAQFTHTYAKAGTYAATISNQDTQQVLQSVTVTVGGAVTLGAANATLSVAPASGPAPLNVTFTVTDTSASCPRPAIALTAGDGSASVTALPATVTCTGIAPATLNYTYRNAGTFTAALTDTNTKRVFQTATVTVTPGAAVTATVPPLSVVSSTPTTGTVNVSRSLLNLTNNIGTPRTVPSGTWGEIQANASGVTITASGHDTDGRTGIGGFYGYDAIPGVQPQDLARQMCAARPWGSSSATATIPPSFYDSICTARGYGAGTVTPKPAAPSSAAQPSSPKTSAATSTRPAGPTAVIVPAKVHITAVPSSVKIGSRTSIFWNAVGVKSCLVTSPDGSFKENKLSGAASTVALTGETVFSIVCIKPDDSQVSNFVKVKIAI